LQVVEKSSTSDEFVEQKNSGRYNQKQRQSHASEKMIDSYTFRRNTDRCSPLLLLHQARNYLTEWSTSYTELDFTHNHLQNNASTSLRQSKQQNFEHVDWDETTPMLQAFSKWSRFLLSPPKLL